MKTLLLILIVLCISSCRQYPSPDADQKLLSHFESLCKSHASEFVTENSAVGGLRIYEQNLPANRGPGRADRPVHEPEYGAHALAKMLLTPPNSVAFIRFIYHPYPLDWQNLQEECRGPFYVDLRAPNDRVQRGAPRICTSLTRYDRDLDDTRYAVQFEYGELDSNEIRPFSIRLYDVLTERILAEQKSFQLLRGNLSDKNRSFTYLGWSQHAYTCNLTPPDILLKRAFQVSSSEKM